MSSSFHGVPPGGFHGLSGTQLAGGGGGGGNTLSNGLVHWYSLEEESGTRVDEISSYDLLDVNTALYDTGKVGNGIKLDAATNDSVHNIDPPAAFMSNTMGEQAIAFWTKNTEAGSAHGSSIISFLSDSLSWTLVAQGYVEGWNHVVCQIEDNGAHGLMAVYWNKVKDSEAFATAPSRTNDQMAIGGGPQSWAATTNAVTDNVGIWNRNLTETEISDHYDLWVPS
jgi:hypothetical protein